MKSPSSTRSFSSSTETMSDAGSIAGKCPSSAIRELVLCEFAKRDASINRMLSAPSPQTCSLISEDVLARKRRSCDWSTLKELRHTNGHESLRRSNTMGDRNGRHIGLTHRPLRQADSCSLLESSDKAVSSYTPNRSRSLPPLIEALCESNPIQTRPLSRSVTEENLGSDQPPDENLWLRRDSISSCGSLSEHEDNDDVFGEHCSSSKSPEEKLKMLRHKHGNVDVLAETSSKCSSSSLMNGYDRTSSCSGLSSGSTDSAIDKSTSDPHQEILSRMADLEQELITTKCELAKVLNQQTFFQEVLEKKDAIINELDQTLDQLGVADIKRHLLYGGKFLTTKKGKVLEERVRVLQNQNRFLNEEVKRLAKNRHSEQDRFREQEERLRGYEAEIEGWKRNYVSIVQSCIHYPTGDAMDGPDVTLFGEDMHKVTIKGLLTEARRTNPSLPTFERLASSPHHVDHYGFRHSHENTGLLLHYICQQLNQHYTMQLINYEEHQLHWKEYLCEHRDFTRSDKELKELCRGGIPHQYRKEVWRRLVYTQVQDLRKEKGCHFYRNLCNSLPDSQLAARYRKQISLDLMRTMPSNVKFSSASSKGIHDLQDVLLAYCIHNPSVGYCQGLNFIVAMALLIMDPQDAFWTLIAVTEKYFSPNYFNHNLIGAQADQEVLREIIHDKLPKLYQHLEDIDIEISTVTLNWFMAIFFDAVPFETLLRLWDCFLLEGPKVLFRFSLAILKIHEGDLLQKTDTISVMRHLKACAKLTYDADRLIKTAFEDLGLFPSRRDISVKQTCYLNVLKEKYKKREWHKRAYVEREQMLLEQKADTENAMLIECVAAYDEGKVWLCHTQENVSNVCKVNCSENMMYNLSLQFEARILCMKALREDIMLIGTVAWTLFAYDTRSREEKWHVQLHDAVLCLCVHKEGRHRRVFAGLADGTVAVLENVRSSPPKSDVYYVPVGKSSVTSIVVFNNQLWCASGNMVYVLHSSNLDPMDNFTVSANPYDQVLTLVPGDYGMWISLKGSSILELWDTKTLNCKMLYDTRSGRYPNLRKEDDSYFNKARITSVLANNSTVIVGTGDGVMITFEVVEKNPLKSSPEGSSCSESRSSSPFWIQGHKGVALNSNRESQEKVKDYFRRLDSPQEETSSALETPSCDSVTDFSIDDQMTKRFQDFGNVSYPSSLACSEISTDFFNPDNNSVQNKGDNFANREQGDLILGSEDDEPFVDLESGDLPSGSTPTGEKEVLILADIFCDNMSDIDDINNGNLNLSESNTRQNIMTSNKNGKEVKRDESNGNVPTKEPADTLDNFTPTQSSMDYDSSKTNVNSEEVVETDFSNNINNNNVPKICIANEMCKAQEDNLGNEESFEDPSFKTSVTSSESFRSCEGREDTDMPVDQITAENGAENSLAEKGEGFFEDDVFYEAITGSSLDVSKTTDVMVTEFKRTSSPIPEKEKTKNRMSRFRRRPKKLNSEIQYRLDFSDIKVSIESTMSSSSLSDKRSSLLSNFYPSDSSLDQLKNRGRGDNSFNMFSKSESKLHVETGTKPPIVIKAEKPESGRFGILSGFERVCSLDTHMDSVGLSSLDDVSSYKESSETKGRLMAARPQISHNSSCTSLCSLTEAQLYSFDLNLQAKVKISDKPVKCLLPTSVKQEPIIISCSGSYGDDEAVLRWRREPDEKIWTNEPIYEICERTHQARLPSYMISSRRLSSVSSIQSGDSQTSTSSVIAMGNT